MKADLSLELEPRDETGELGHSRIAVDIPRVRVCGGVAVVEWYSIHELEFGQLNILVHFDGILIEPVRDQLAFGVSV